MLTLQVPEVHASSKDLLMLLSAYIAALKFQLKLLNKAKYLYEGNSLKYFE